MGIAKENRPNPQAFMEVEKSLKLPYFFVLHSGCIKKKSYICSAKQIMIYHAGESRSEART